MSFENLYAANFEALLAAAVVADPAGEVSQRVAVRAALERLGELDREVLRMTAWEGLEPREAAEVLGINAAAAAAVTGVLAAVPLFSAIDPRHRRPPRPPPSLPPPPSS